MKSYTSKYIIVITDNDSYAGYVYEDDDIDVLRLEPFEWDNGDIDDEAIKLLKNTVVIRPFTVDIKKAIIKTVYIIPRIY